MPPQDEHLLAGARIPDPDGAVVTSGRETGAVLAERGAYRSCPDKFATRSPVAASPTSMTS
jgi:hypothetical protein